MQLMDYCCYILGITAIELNIEQLFPLLSHKEWIKRIQRYRWPPPRTIVFNEPFFNYSPKKSDNNEGRGGGGSGTGTGGGGAHTLHSSTPKKECIVQ
jgi:hypothetical protein